MDVGLLGDVAFGILPVVNLETPSAGLIAESHVEIFFCFNGIELCAIIDVCHSVLTSIVGIRTTLASVGGKGDAVVIDTEVLLVIGLGRPPLCTSGTCRAATHVCSLFVGYAPLLVTEAAEVGRVVHLCLVEGEFLLQASLRDSIAVTEFQLH